jgi:hypothetical protein
LGQLIDSRQIVPVGRGPIEHGLHATHFREMAPTENVFPRAQDYSAYLKSAGIARMQTDVWIDDAGYLAKSVCRLPEGIGYGYTNTTTFYGWNLPVKITAPRMGS